jgi:hypothetical protein
MLLRPQRRRRRRMRRRRGWRVGGERHALRGGEGVMWMKERFRMLDAPGRSWYADVCC